MSNYKNWDILSQDQSPEEAEIEKKLKAEKKEKENY